MGDRKGRGKSLAQSATPVVGSTALNEPLDEPPPSSIFSDVIRTTFAPRDLPIATGAVTRPPESLDHRRAPERRSRQMTRPSCSGWYTFSPSTVGAMTIMRSDRYSHDRLKGSANGDLEVAPRSAMASDLRGFVLDDDVLAVSVGLLDCTPWALTPRTPASTDATANVN